MLHERHATMVAGADGDAVRVEQRTDVVRVPALEIEGDDGDLLRRFAHDGESFDGLEALGRRGEQDLLVRVRGLLDLHHVFKATPSAMAPEMSGVPASKRSGASRKVVPAK